MIFNTRTSVPVLLLGGALLSLLAPAAARADAADVLPQVAGILDYIASDYAGAVASDGRITNDFEYREQKSLMTDAIALTREAGLGAGSDIGEELLSLSRRIDAREAPDQVLAHCRSIRTLMVKEHGLILRPPHAPDLANGRELYAASGCASCHGEDGSADTESARALDPRPANFLDPERMAGVSPYRAYHAITHGVKGTSMPAGKGLSEEERWDLAFLALALRYATADRELGARVLSDVEPERIPDLTALTGMNDDELDAALVGSIRDDDARLAAMAFLRSPAAPRDDLSLAKRLLRGGLRAYEAGNRTEAKRAFVAAYLDGFEPREPSLRTRNPEAVAEIESAMLALRQEVGEGVPQAQIRERTEALLGLLDEAQGGKLEEGAILASSAVIALREGGEAVILIIALLALLRRRGAHGLVKHVHLGWTAALALGFATWLLAGHLLGGLERELAEGIIALLAAVILVGVTHWIIGQASHKRWMGFLSRHVKRAASGRFAGVAVFGFAFIAVYREVFETVLFYQALVLDAGNHTSMVWLGLGLGVLALAAGAFVLRLVGKRLRPRPFILASGVLLGALSVTLAGKGIRALQEAGVLSVTDVLPSLQVSVLGLHGTLEGLAAQLALLLALTVTVVSLPLRFRRRQPAYEPTPAE